jgi:hypothetical protein
VGVKRKRGSHRLLTKPGWPDYEFAFHDHDEVGPRMLARIAKSTGLNPSTSERSRLVFDDQQRNIIALRCTAGEGV